MIPQWGLVPNVIGPREKLPALIAVLCFAILVSTGGCDQSARLLGGGGNEPKTDIVGAFEARVTKITDGDSLTALDALNRQHTIRLAEIDSPERGQPWGNRSRQGLSALVFAKTVSVQQTDTDRYGRVVARLFAGDVDVNRAMVEQGDAWAYRQYLTDETLIAVEARAREQRIGLWSLRDGPSIPPWEWRRGVRNSSAGSDTLAARAKPQPLLTPGLAGQSAVASFSCTGKQYCTQMESCAEANFYLSQCGLASLDGNNDGQPCEALCSVPSH